ncbi:uncharacterized protein B0P05DRAFT_549434 [Gilbertella persicaria]|uniref:Mso1 N-terminal domain-containing protein n=1 Tax=Rhizopus stolonifer TaxID=4846 RepID=A0A367KY92_RHIST|nr:uncharacterized protein B0P05DRAFT_549434 [Gilbertella persicaria]KAI8072237.1 hypothetical protein B0P05DRAFT_549434 [Gilbertella persicaria]RCI07155.1 hypothetical protein CU098_013123 [Rhizopus stolonifer]
MGLKNDYRISAIVVLCKDCGQDVGLYPARHICSSSKNPQLPILCSSTTSPSFESWHHQEEETKNVPELISSFIPVKPTQVTRQPSDSSTESEKWSFFRSTSKNSNPETPEKEEHTSYLDAYALNLKRSISLRELNGSSATTHLQRAKTTTGKKAKENEKWKELIADKHKPGSKTSSSWFNIISSSTSQDIEYCSDQEDWEGETHVARIIREYHEEKHKARHTPLPSWLYDDRTPISALAQIPVTEQAHQEQVRLRREHSNRRRLWEASETRQPTQREREIQAMRATSITKDHDLYSKTNSISRSCSERVSNSSSRQKTSISPASNQHSLFNGSSRRLKAAQISGSFYDEDKLKNSHYLYRNSSGNTKGYI